jgi:hypothetical protein
LQFASVIYLYIPFSRSKTGNENRGLSRTSL